MVFEGSFRIFEIVALYALLNFQRLLLRLSISIMFTNIYRIYVGCFCAKCVYERCFTYAPRWNRRRSKTDPRFRVAAAFAPVVEGRSYVLLWPKGRVLPTILPGVFTTTYARYVLNTVHQCVMASDKQTFGNKYPVKRLTES